MSTKLKLTSDAPTRPTVQSLSSDDHFDSGFYSDFWISNCCYCLN